MYLDDKASPELARTMLQLPLQYADPKALEQMRSLEKDVILLAQYLGTNNFYGSGNVDTATNTMMKN